MERTERRRQPRQRSYLSGRMIFNGSNSSQDALVRNVSAQGARLETNGLAAIPGDFLLQIHNGSSADVRRKAHRIWSDGRNIGVAFEQ